MYDRHVTSEVLDALADTRIVFLMGARQVGKSTLAEGIATTAHPATRYSLDNDQTLAAVQADPGAFVAGLPGAVLIDEVQREPRLLLEIKDAVDADQKPGRFLLTGSANVLTAPKVAEALTGRAEFIRIWPLSQGEIEGSRETLIDRLFQGQPPLISGATKGRSAFADRIALGGYPEARQRRTARRRNAWFKSYLDTTLTRDLRELSGARKLDRMPRLLKLLAGRAGNIVEFNSFAGELGLDRKTIEDYTGLLETIFIVRRVPAWRPGITNRMVHASKLYVVDSGLLTHLLGANSSRIANDDRLTGMLLENFVGMEILKQLEWSDTEAAIYHFRDRDNYEVDIVLESTTGEVVGIEVKAGTAAQSNSFRGLRRLRSLSKDKFKAGIVLNTSDTTVSFGDDLWAVPISALWT